jgi:hypothetical protein
MNLAIIITGQLRTFFCDKIQQSYKQLITLSKMNYKNIVFILVINDSYNVTDINSFSEKNNIPTIIVDFNSYNQAYNEFIDRKIQSEEYQNLKREYFQKNSQAIREVYDIDNITRIYNIQSYQLKIGINTLLNYEKEHNLQYDVMMRTRFDVAYPDLFFPDIPDGSFMTKLLLNDHFKKRFIKSMDEHDISIHPPEKIVSYLKEQQLNLDSCRVDFSKLNFSFGGHFYYNYKSVENILNGSDKRLYSINDTYFFGKRDVFLKFLNYADEYSIKSPKINILHYFTTEAQYCIFCDNNDIDFLMYFPMYYPNDDIYNIIR